MKITLVTYIKPNTKIGKGIYTSVPRKTECIHFNGIDYYVYLVRHYNDGVYVWVESCDDMDKRHKEEIRVMEEELAEKQREEIRVMEEELAEKQRERDALIKELDEHTKKSDEDVKAAEEKLEKAKKDLYNLTPPFFKLKNWYLTFMILEAIISGVCLGMCFLVPFITALIGYLVFAYLYITTKE